MKYLELYLILKSFIIKSY